MELHPRRRADGGIDREPHGVVADVNAAADLEPEPVADVGDCSSPQFLLGDLPGHLAVGVHVQTCAHADVAGEERRRPLDDPSVVEQVQPLDQAVVRDLAL